MRAEVSKFGLLESSQCCRWEAKICAIYEKDVEGITLVKLNLAFFGDTGICSCCDFLSSIVNIFFTSFALIDGPFFYSKIFVNRQTAMLQGVYF